MFSDAIIAANGSSITMNSANSLNPNCISADRFSLRMNCMAVLKPIKVNKPIETTFRDVTTTWEVLALPLAGTTFKGLPGDVKPGEEVLVTWRAVPKSLVGPWTVYYYPGEEMVTHLTKRSGGVSYASTWWNAKGDDTKSPDSRDLPTTPGETVVPRPEPAMQTPL